MREETEPLPVPCITGWSWLYDYLVLAIKILSFLIYFFTNSVYP